MVGSRPMFTPGLIRLAHWVAEYYVVPAHRVLRTMLPQAVRDKPESFITDSHLKLAGEPSAEVMDKELSVPQIWLFSLVSAVVGFIVCRFRPPLGIVTLAIAGIFLCGVLSEVFDPSIGPSIQREFGPGYLFHTCAAAGVVVLSHALGIFLNRRKYKRP